MAQFDFYRAPNGRGYWLDCQTDLMEDFNLRMVVPMIRLENAPKPIRQLNPVVVIEGERFVLATHYASAIPVGELGHPVGSLSSHRYEIIKAFEFLVTGV